MAGQCQLLAPFFVQRGQNKISTEKKEFALDPQGSILCSVLTMPFFPPINPGSELT